MHGGDQIADILIRHGVNTLFTLCGGHISPILVGCKQKGIRVIDTRHEATAVFAADAMARLTGVPGVAVVTAGPGATNTITAVKNAQLAQSPLVLIGGAAATALKGRGALQDINLVQLFKPVVKWSRSITRVKDIIPVMEKAFHIAQAGVPGPVFIECPVDLLYPESLVRQLYTSKTTARSLAGRLQQWYLNKHVNRLFADSQSINLSAPQAPAPQLATKQQLKQVTQHLLHSQQPLLLIGSQVLLNVAAAEKIRQAVIKLGIPVYLTGMARGMLGKHDPLQLRHKRRAALKEADLVITAGVPCDFRLDYGNHIRAKSYLIGVNRSRHDLRLNRRPNYAIHADPGQFLCDLAETQSNTRQWPQWLAHLTQRDKERSKEISQMRGSQQKINPIDLFYQLDAVLSDTAIIVTDGGDFVATASYILSPPKILSWLDPGVFGTLGVGAGFALAAKLCNPEADVWIVYGDGAVGYSITEFDTFVRHNIPVIAVVGNDASWGQVARDQLEIFQDDVGTSLCHNHYHLVAEGLGATGILLDESSSITQTLTQALQQSRQQSQPVLINVLLAKSDFRKGSISM